MEDNVDDEGTTEGLNCNQEEVEGVNCNQGDVEMEGTNEGLNFNQEEVDGVNCNQWDVEIEGSEDNTLNVNFEDSENDIRVDGEIAVDDEEVTCENKGWVWYARKVVH